METYLPISYLNDFIFCPRSIYFHQLYGRASKRLYHTEVQVKGLAAHKTIDTQKYSTSKKVLQGMEVYSEKYNIGGKIDIFDQVKSILVERKKKIKVIYDGYIYQLYAQYYCLVEMGYKVDSIKLYSMDDNKSYPIKKPEEDIKLKTDFDNIVKQIRSFDLTSAFTSHKNKCKYCIYNNLCDRALC